MTTNRDRFLRYLRLYEAKDLWGISEMFTNEVTLRDWRQSISGRDAVVADINRNFGAADTLEIEVLQCYESLKSVAGELRILVNRSVELRVVDVIDFDELGYVTAIRAYLGLTPR